MHTSPTTGEPFEKRIVGYFIAILFIIPAAAAYVALPGLVGHDVADAAICASCHTDGRTGVPPPTPTHIRMGLVAAPKPVPSAAATTGTAPAGTASAPKASSTTAPTSAPKATATAVPGASRTKTVAAGNAPVCAQCHRDGRSGLTPPGHRSITGMFGNGTAPPPKGTAGGVATHATGGQGKAVAGGGGAKKAGRPSEDRAEMKSGRARETD